MDRYPPIAEHGLIGEQLGNFPQAFTHLSLINAAINLDHQLDHGAGKTPSATSKEQPAARVVAHLAASCPAPRPTVGRAGRPARPR